MTVVSVGETPAEVLCVLSRSPSSSAFTSQRRKSEASLRSPTVNRSLLLRTTSFTN